MTEVFEDHICPFCGCLCDDLRIEVENGKVIKNENGCAISIAKFMNHHDDRIESPMIKKAAVSLDEAIDKTVEILASAKRPLIYGLSLYPTPRTVTISSSLGAAWRSLARRRLTTASTTRRSPW